MRELTDLNHMRRGATGSRRGGTGSRRPAGRDDWTCAVLWHARDEYGEQTDCKFQKHSLDRFNGVK